MLALDNYHWTQSEAEMLTEPFSIWRINFLNALKPCKCNCWFLGLEHDGNVIFLQIFSHKPKQWTNWNLALMMLLHLHKHQRYYNSSWGPPHGGARGRLRDWSSGDRECLYKISHQFLQYLRPRDDRRSIPRMAKIKTTIMSQILTHECF